MTKKILYTLIASAAVGMSSSALGSAITNLDLAAATPFGGFEWSQNGTAVSSPGPSYVTGDIVTTVYFADADGITKVGGGAFSTPNLLVAAPGGAFGAGQYEYTVVAVITEVVTCGFIGSPDGTPCTGVDTAFFSVVSGSYDIYYDYAGLGTGNTVANQITGTGFTDGDLLLSGSINPGFAGFFNPVLSFGAFGYHGTVTTTNSAYITPDQNGTSALSTLQFGSTVTNWTPATGTPVGAIPADSIQFQADGNQAFSVPEPGSLALLGLGLLGLVAVGGRRKLQ